MTLSQYLETKASSNGRVRQWPRRSIVKIGLLLLLFASVSHAADLNVLIIGSDTGTSDIWSTYPATDAFSPGTVKQELQNILSGAGLGSVNVEVWDHRRTETIIVTNGTSTSTTTFNCANLSGWYYWPYPADVETTTRWPSLRGEKGTEWDYVILIGDPGTIENLPGLYTHGVARPFCSCNGRVPPPVRL